MVSTTTERVTAVATEAFEGSADRYGHSASPSGLDRDQADDLAYVVNFQSDQALRKREEECRQSEGMRTPPRCGTVEGDISFADE